jgi:ankyrin repeat protein
MSDILKVKELLKKHTSCITLDYYKRTPLYSAVLSEHEEVVEELLDYRVDTSVTSYKGQTALHIAAQSYAPPVH